MLTKQNTQFINQLNNLLYKTNPELLSYCQGGMAEWILKLLIKYPSASRLKKTRAKAVTTIPYISSKRTQLLIVDAKHSIPKIEVIVKKLTFNMTVFKINFGKLTVKTRRIPSRGHKIGTRKAKIYPQHNCPYLQK